jgi:hypothetical protein
MTISIALVVLSALALLFLIRLAKGQAIAPRIAENPAEHIRFVDLEAFRNLIDPDEQEYLRSQLPPAAFRKIQRERLRAAAEYISCAAHNAAVLLRMAEAARHSPDPQVAAMAEKLVENAIRLRLYAFQAIPRLYITMLLPLRQQSPVRVADRYEQMTRQVVVLGLQYPMRGIGSAL